MLIIHLETGLYPDSQTVSAAVHQLAAGHEVRSLDLRRLGLTDRDWDAVIDAILAADRVIGG
jgi:hypothetical protein